MARRPTARQAIPKNVLVELSSSHNKACMFCGQKEISEKLYGLLYQLNDVICHYFCIVNRFFQIFMYIIFIYNYILVFSYYRQEPFKMVQTGKGFGAFY